MTYSIVIATRNRSEALKLSLPWMLAQTRPPHQIIIVDSSDDLEASSMVIKAILKPSNVDWRLESSERGITRQRNLGLSYSTHPVTMFPDDDAIWFPNTAEEIMAVYDRDIEQEISAVCATESNFPPKDFPTTRRAGYSVSFTDRVRLRVMPWRRCLESTFVPDPLLIVGQAFTSSFSLPSWFFECGVVPVDYMTGFRMSFRTAIARKNGFDTHLANYAVFEDVDASFNAWRSGAVVAARKAQVYHHRSPERRGDAKQIAVQQILARAYVTAKHSSPGSRARAYLRPFCQYKTFLYLLASRSAYGRARFSGARAALRELRTFATVPSEQAAESYSQSTVRCTNGQTSLT